MCNKKKTADLMLLKKKDMKRFIVWFLNHFIFHNMLLQDIAAHRFDFIFGKINDESTASNHTSSSILRYSVTLSVRQTKNTHILHCFIFERYPTGEIDFAVRYSHEIWIPSAQKKNNGIIMPIRASYFITLNSTKIFKVFSLHTSNRYFTKFFLFTLRMEHYGHFH